METDLIDQVQEGMISAKEFNPTAPDEFASVISPISDTDIKAAHTGSLILRVVGFLALSIAAIWLYKRIFR